MKKIAVMRRENKPIGEWKKLIINHGFIIDQKKPDIVFCVGGDGTFLIAERIYPKVPKILFRESKIGVNCTDLPASILLKKLSEDNFVVKEYEKLEAYFKNMTLTAANDIVIRNKVPTSAIRFLLHNGNKKFKEEFIGDGAVIATSFGSRGYFYSITKKIFEKGFGIAWNNLTKNKDHIFTKNIDVVLELTRGEAVVVADNDIRMFELKKGDKVRICSSKDKAKILAFDFNK